MKNNLVNYFNMFLNTQDYLDEKSATWSTIPRIVSYKNDFDALLLRIMEMQKKAQGNVAVTERKNQLKRVIAIKTAIVAGALQAYAYETGNMDLVHKTKIAPSSIEKMKEVEVDALVHAILTQVQIYLAELADYGVTDALVTEISTTLDDFNALIGKPRALLNTKYVALSTLDQLFDEANGLLNNKMDKLMLMFKDSGTDFYEGYERSRVIVDR